MRSEIGSKMATDDERRRVAAALRGMHDYETPIPIIRTCLGLRPGMLMDGETRRRMSDRLADLIEPSCDREALLALAVNLDARAAELLKVNDLDQSRQRRSARQAHAMDLMAACSRVREALGVVS